LINNGVFDKKMAITLDNASNNDAFIQELIKRDSTFTAEHHVRCFGHILNLSSKDALAEVEEELSGIRRYLKLIVSSPKLLHGLKEDFADQGGKDYVKPILDVPTRWKSTVTMIERARRLKDGLVVTMDRMYYESVRRRMDEERLILVTEEHWKNFKVVCHFTGE
jgi:hypothetical protein